MQVRLLVPGLKAVNREWMKNLSSSLDSSWLSIEYPWWNNDEAEINIEPVIDAMTEANPDIVIAKSIGTLFTSIALNRGLISPKYIVFLGVPKKAISEEEYGEILTAIGDEDSSFLIIQQTNDFLGSFAEICESVKVESLDLFEINGSDHLYDDFIKISEKINNWGDVQVNNHRQSTR
ncbi:hypothetical protein [Marinomonas mediterranea]|uniref:hypothetical protein n=1 Tax=Marinomonas mediterranea TaxID=119864 RepID=UPI00234AF01A|nr:hypothetical protein [Marinomonas mediterranea]WCN08898.1 hypothetical protein GV055_08180 [Marinomonas mediterranea]